MLRRTFVTTELVHPEQKYSAQTLGVLDIDECREIRRCRRGQQNENTDIYHIHSSVRTEDSSYTDTGTSLSGHEGRVGTVSVVGVSDHSHVVRSTAML